MTTTRPYALLAFILFVSVAAFACGSGGPAIDPLENAVAAVGSEFVLEVKASNSSGGDISFSYDSNATVGDRGGLKQRPGGSAVFAWTPSAQDIGVWTFDFHALDASGKATESITIEVKSAIGSASIPTFNRPLGAGTTLDLQTKECVELEVLLEDKDSLAVAIEEADPKIEGATLVPDGDLGAIWRWCPSEQQVAARDRYLLTLAADDSENPKALKHYQIILRHGVGSGCRGGRPEIEHMPQDITSVRDVAFQARVIDPAGVKAPPVLYWSPTPVSNPPNLDSMSQATMVMKSGNANDGVWEAIVPNLAVADPQSATRTIHYVIIADDNDDKGGKCDHVSMQIYSANITDPGGSGGLALCEPCSSSPQCGGDLDLCLSATAAGEARCFQACDDTTPCPQGYECSGDALVSVDGMTGRQCLPLVGNCTQSTCADDSLEPNATGENATPVTAFTEDVSPELVLCPKAGMTADEDWFEITTTEEGFVNFYLQGPIEDSEVDLSLYDADGKILAKSENWGPSDNTGRCVPPGTYRAQVYSYFNKENPYKIGYQFEPQSCEVSTCEDDLFEDDDNEVYGRVSDLSEGYHSTDNRICPYDEDWFFMFLEAGETAHVRLDFEQTNAFDDLDIHFYDGNNGAYLTQCRDDNPAGCDPNNGQGSTSNERLTWTVAETGYYFAIVKGFSGSANRYDICIGKKPEDCGL